MPDNAIDAFMTSLPDRFGADGAGGTAASVQFHFTGAQTADWSLEIEDGVCRTAPGLHPNPSVTVTMDSEDFMALLAGELKPMPAFMQGKLRLKGDVSLAMKLPGMFF